MSGYRLAGVYPQGEGRYAADDALAGWVQRGLEFVCGLRAKPVRVSS